MSLDFDEINERAKKEKEDFLRLAECFVFRPLVLLPNSDHYIDDIPPGLTAGDAFIDTTSEKDYWDFKKRMAKQGRLREFRWEDERKNNV